LEKDMLRKILLSAVAISVVAGPLAMAQEQTAPAEKPAAAQSQKSRGFGRIDADKDGFITPEEFSKRRIDALKTADANGDGELSQEELVAFIQKREFERRARAMSRRLDVDGDGKVTIAELERQNEKHLALLDTNDDGKVSPEELRRAHRVMGKGMGPGHMGPRHMGADQRHGRWEGRGAPHFGQFRGHRMAPDHVTTDAPAAETPAAQ